MERKYPLSEEQKAADKIQIQERLQETKGWLDAMLSERGIQEVATFDALELTDDEKRDLDTTKGVLHYDPEEDQGIYPHYMFYRKDDGDSLPSVRMIVYISGVKQSLMAADIFSKKFGHQMGNDWSQEEFRGLIKNIVI